MPTTTPPEPATIRLPATAWDVPPEPIRRLNASHRVGTAVTGGALLLLGIGIMTRDSGGLFLAAPGVLMLAIALLQTLRHLADEGATTFLRTTGAVRLEHDPEASPEW